MNIFFLDNNILLSIKYHCDKHIVKMILEIVQMLYTAHILNCSDLSFLPSNHYKKISNHSHPMAVWVRTCKENYLYAAEIAITIAYEYTFRYNRVHSCEKHLNWLINNIPVNQPVNKPVNNKKITRFATNNYFISKKITPIPLCMPEDCYSSDPIISYRNYYIKYKKHFTKWTDRNIPYWFNYSDIRKYFEFVN